MIVAILFSLLAVDDAGVFHGDLSHDAGAIVAIVLALIALVLVLKNQT